MTKIAIGFILYFFFTCFAHAQQNDFDKICKIYSTVLSKKMDARTGSKYISDNIKLTIRNKIAVEAHNNIYLVSQQKRYPLFKKIAEHTLKRHWECSSMMRLLNNPPR